MGRGKRLRRFAVRQLAAVLLATAGLVVVSVTPAHALYKLNQSFENRDDGAWYWGLVGQGSGEWYTGQCAQALTGCGGVLLGHGPTGWTTLYTTVRLGALDYGWCSIGYSARRWNSAVAPTARLEVLRPDYTYISLTDKTLTNAWTYVGTGFYQYGARDVIIRITLPASASGGSVGINVDDLTIDCRVLIEGRG
ncbi:hypothetical protein AB0J72_41310 [Dactylosporangium sp. NPDC049742]|uniref:hypothetical protein n=1 Tax=Dactylosporangium sp. NPDC049742 TaxID=3154737 RepID=UPI003420E485